MNDKDSSPFSGESLAVPLHLDQMPSSTSVDMCIPQSFVRQIVHQVNLHIVIILVILPPKGMQSAAKRAHEQ